LPAALAFAAYGRWVLHPSLADATGALIETTAPAGPWVGLNASVRHRGGYPAPFLLDTASGRSVPLVGPLRFIAFTRDGRQALWLAAVGDPLKTPQDLYSLDLA